MVRFGVTYALVGLLSLSAPLARGSEGVPTLGTQVDLDAALTRSLDREDAARATITTLLQRDDVRSLAQGHGLDLRRAEAAVSTLQGDELQRLAALADNAQARLAGGDQIVRVSLVALLLIVIIVVLIS